MSFLEPMAFWLLLPAGVLIWRRRYAPATERFVLDPRLLIGGAGHPVWQQLKTVALLLMIVALARPVLHRPSLAPVPDAQPVYLAVDASYSMRAADRGVTRYAFARAVIDRLLRIDTVHPFGLMAFTSNALMLSPPTRDRALLESALAMLDTNNIITRSTDLATLFESVSKLPEGTKRLVIFSDGGDGGDPARLLQLCRAAGIVVYGVACASGAGSPVPTDGGGWLRDGHGNMIISVQNPLLQQLAEATGGTAVDTADADAAADALASALSETVSGGKTAEASRYTELFWIPLLAALLLYTAAVLRPPRRLRRLAAPLLLLLGLQAEAGMLDGYWLQRAYSDYGAGDWNASAAALAHVAEPSLQREYMQGALYYRQGAYKKAGQVFSAIRSHDPQVKRILYYNLGNCAARLGRYKSARDFYVKALQLGDDPDARENLAQLLFLTEQQQKKPAVHADKSVKASGKGGESEQKPSETKRASSKSGEGQSGSGGAKGGSAQQVRKAVPPASRAAPHRFQSLRPDQQRIYQ